MADYTCKDIDKHYILYAKNWYMKNSLFYDLAIIHSDKYLVDFKYITVGDIASKMASIAIDILIKTKINKTDAILKFMDAISPGDFLWVLSGEQYEFYKAIVLKSINVIACAPIKNLDPEKDIDFNILPRKKDNAWQKAGGW